MERFKIIQFINTEEGNEYVGGEILLNDGINLLVKYKTKDGKEFLVLHTINTIIKLGVYNFCNLEKALKKYNENSKLVIEKYKKQKNK